MQAPQIDPVLLHLGPLQVRWYGLMYVIGFVIATQILKKFNREGFFKVAPDKVDNLITYCVIGMFIFARLAYVFIYNWDYYGNHLDELFAVWKGGLSFHGAIFGMALGIWLYAKHNNVSFFHVSDVAVVAGTQGLFFGRMGNFINGELYGRVTTSPIGMVFPDGGPYPRHASQVYEALFEGIILFVILWFLKKKVKFEGILTGVFFIGYGVFRFGIEFFREADQQVGYYLGGNITMGQILCFIMIIVGMFLILVANKKQVLVGGR